MAIREIIRHRVAIAGWVTDEQSRKALEGVRVEITDQPPAFARRLEAHALRLGERGKAMTPRPDRTRTAADGHFHFLDLPPGSYRLSASLPSAGSRYGEATAQVPVEDGEVATAELALSPTTVKGRVLNNEDKGVAMAEVRILGSGERVYSDGGGSYRLGGLETGRRRLEVTAQGYSKTTAEVMLDPSGAVAELTVNLEKPKKHRNQRLMSRQVPTP